MNKTCFSVRETNVVKGVAICMILIQHLFLNHTQNYVWLVPKLADIVESEIMSACVPIYLLLSGIGLTYGYEKKKTSDIGFSLQHTWKLMLSFWFVFILFVPLGLFFEHNPVLIYGTGWEGFKNGLIDFFGFARQWETPTMNTSWWYMGVVIPLYLIFPLLYRMARPCKGFLILLLGLSRMYFIEIVALQWWVAFLIGIVVAQNKVPEAIMEYTKQRPILSRFAALVVFVLCFLRSYGEDPHYNVLFGLAVWTFVLVWFAHFPILGNCLAFLGKHAGNIYFFHVFLYLHYFPRFFVGRYPIVSFGLLLGISLLISIGLEWVKKTIGFHKLYGMGKKRV